MGGERNAQDAQTCSTGKCWCGDGYYKTFILAVLWGGSSNIKTVLPFKGMAVFVFLQFAIKR